VTVDMDRILDLTVRRDSFAAPQPSLTRDRR